MDENGYPHYRRRNTGITYLRNGNYRVDNKWVVPYCPVLLEMFDCHMNVEIVSTILAVKYLYKYIDKGHDAATITIEKSQSGNIVDLDEIHDSVL